MMAEAPAFITVPQDHTKKKKNKVNITNAAMVFNSLNPTLPIVMPGAAPHLEETSRSTPNSPERRPERRPSADSSGAEGGKKSKNFFKKHLSRPRSPRRRGKSNSDPESSSTSPSPQPRPKLLGLKKRKSPGHNGATSSESDRREGSASIGSSELEATPVETLPGRTHPMANCASGTDVPEIRVSSEAHEGGTGASGGACGGMVSFEDISGALDPGQDPYRKNSQSSRCSSGSGLMSVGISSGIGSLLSPSGDESCSDIESPLSPYSGASSFTEETPGDISDSDPIDKDYISTSGGRKSGSMGSLTVTTPTPTSESPPAQLNYSSTTLVSPSSPDGKELKEHKKKRDKDKDKKQNVWMKVRNAVKAWSPFAVQFKKRYYPWVQLAGHAGNFMPGEENGTIMKKSVENESRSLRGLNEDVAVRNFVPEFKREVEHNGEVYVEMTDLLREFNDPAVMDIKMGTRTYLEEELGKKNALRKDLYLKMIKVDQNEPSAEEHAQEAITKPRYMQWRESLSSTSTLGFRIEGIKTTTGRQISDFKKTRTSEEVTEALQNFLSENPAVKGPFLRRLMEIRNGLERSTFFAKHELIGSSLLFVYDNSGLATVHMIDFGKTIPLTEGVSISHLDEWVEGNHEDGYLIGLDNLIRLWRDL